MTKSIILSTGYVMRQAHPAGPLSGPSKGCGIR